MSVLEDTEKRGVARFYLRGKIYTAKAEYANNTVKISAENTVGDFTAAINGVDLERNPDVDVSSLGK